MTLILSLLLETHSACIRFGAIALKKKIFVLIVLCTTASCSARDILELPPIPNPPPDWEKISITTLQASDCPELEGIYSEPPLVYRSGKSKRFVPSGHMGLYSSYIPFKLGNRSVLPTDAADFMVNTFEIKQPDPTQFFLVYENIPADNVVQLHFRQSEGDFECTDGMIRFPDYQVSGIIEGASLNFQIRNVLVKDVSGALVILSTRGPYHRYSSDSKNEFSYEFIRYPVVDSD